MKTNFSGINRISLWMLLILGLTLGTSSLWASGVQEIQDNPEKYVGKTVRARAYVESKLNVPFTEYAIYVLSEDKRNMPLFAPRKDNVVGKRVSIKAKVYGIKESDAQESGQEMADGFSNFLLDREIAKPETAKKLGSAIIALMNGLGTVSGGSYLLVADRW